MKFYVKKVLFVNRAPFTRFELDFIENEIAVLSAINGSGKTTILSHIVDAWIEMARPHFFSEFEDKQNKYYRFSSINFNLEIDKPSYVYIRFKLGDKDIDYIDIRGRCTQNQYDADINISDKIPYRKFQGHIEKTNNVKYVSQSMSKEDAISIFEKSIRIYFPSYRAENPGYLNDPYDFDINFSSKSKIDGKLLNPIEVVTGLEGLMNWLLDVIVDSRVQSSNNSAIQIIDRIQQIMQKILISKNKPGLRLGIGERNRAYNRIQIFDDTTKTTFYPSIYNLSSGESALLCIFGEVLKQADRSSINFSGTENVSGVVLIDEIDKHLHIKLQKEVVPVLMKMFPNIQFIISSHSPFLSIGLADLLPDRTRIFDIDNFGISNDYCDNSLYEEVYEMMTSENQRFRELYENLMQNNSENSLPLIITEGKTDTMHLEAAKKALGIQDVNCEFYQITEDWGDSNLMKLLQQLSKISHSRKYIGIFDRDVDRYIKEIEQGGVSFKDFSNNVYGMCIPIPDSRKDYENISIEFYYSDDEVKKEKDGRSLYFDNEIKFLENRKKGFYSFEKLEEKDASTEYSKKIFDEKKMCELTDYIHSKTTFARLIQGDDEFRKGVNFDNFNLIFDKIRTIINL